MERVVVAGVGIHPFGRFEADYRQLGAVAAREALVDAGVGFDDVETHPGRQRRAEMAKGQNVMDLVGGAAVRSSTWRVRAARAGPRCSSVPSSSRAERTTSCCASGREGSQGFHCRLGLLAMADRGRPRVNPVYFALAAQELLEETDATVEDLADVSVKNHGHAVDNPNAMYRKPVTREEVLTSRMVCPPLTLLMLCAPNEGAAAAVLMSNEEAKRRGYLRRWVCAPSHSSRRAPTTGSSRLSPSRRTARA